MGEVKKSKTHFLAISRNFEQLWFFQLTTKCCRYPIFLGGGDNPKFIFTIFHLVRHIWMHIQNFRPLQPFLLWNSILGSETDGRTNERTHRSSYTGGAHLKKQVINTFRYGYRTITNSIINMYGMVCCFKVFWVWANTYKISWFDCYFNKLCSNLTISCSIHKLTYQLSILVMHLL